MKRWSFWWWAPPVVLGLAAALIQAEPHYSPRSFSDRLVLARQILLGAAAVYLTIILLCRMLRALRAAMPLSAQLMSSRQTNIRETAGRGKRKSNPVHFLRPGCCHSSGYNVTGNISGACPKCRMPIGQAVELSN